MLERIHTGIDCKSSSSPSSSIGPIALSNLCQQGRQVVPARAVLEASDVEVVRRGIQERKADRHMVVGARARLHLLAQRLR